MPRFIKLSKKHKNGNGFRAIQSMHRQFAICFPFTCAFSFSCSLTLCSDPFPLPLAKTGASDVPLCLAISRIGTRFRRNSVPFHSLSLSILSPTISLTLALYFLAPSSMFSAYSIAETLKSPTERSIKFSKGYAPVCRSQRHCSNPGSDASLLETR